METFYKKIIIASSKSVNIYLLGDVHEGNCNCDEVSLKKAVRMIAGDENGYWIGMGDYIDAVTHFDSKRFDPATIHPKYRLKDLKNLPVIQTENFYENIKPIKNKCLGLLIGNHEAMYAKYNSMDVYSHLINLMADNEADRRSLTLGMVAIGAIGLQSAKRDRPYQNFTLYLNHGDGGGGILPGYPINKVFQVCNYSLADINAMGHIHQLGYFDPKYIDYDMLVNKPESRLKKVRRLFCVSGTFLTTYVDGNANYFEHKGRRESDIGMIKLSLSLNSVDKHKIYSAEVIKFA